MNRDIGAESEAGAFLAEFAEFDNPDSGAAALAERIDAAEWPESIYPRGYRDPRWVAAFAAALLGPHGLFIADVRKHRPEAILFNGVIVQGCSCGGWDGRTGAYFDHLSVSK